MVEAIWGGQSLVYLAAGVQTIGFLIRDQLLLRALILVGTILYIVYYYIAPELPLWDAILCAVLMGVANAYTMIRLTLDRRTTCFNEEDLAVYRALPQVTPGAFRRLIAVAERVSVSTPQEITREGEMPEYLYYLIEGTFTLEKRGETRHLSGPSFLGEIAYMLDKPASATVVLDSGARYIRWRVPTLKKLTARQMLPENVLEFAFNRDLAVKVIEAR